MCIRVDLPEPDGPIIATNSPSLIVKLTPLRASNGSLSALYTFLIFLISIITQILITSSGYTSQCACATTCTSSIPSYCSQNTWCLSRRFCGRTSDGFGDYDITFF